MEERNSQETTPLGSKPAQESRIGVGKFAMKKTMPMLKVMKKRTIIPKNQKTILKTCQMEKLIDLTSLKTDQNPQEMLKESTMHFSIVKEEKSSEKGRKREKTCTRI